MSDTVLVALKTGVVTGGVGLAGFALNFWSVRNERQQRLTERRDDYREWYGRALFEKRLQAAQQAYSWWRRLNEAIALASGADHDSEDFNSVREIATRPREWYDGNSLYLDGAMTGKSHFVGLTNSAGAWASGRDIDIQQSLNEVYGVVQSLSNRLLSAETTKTEQRTDD